ncbi:MAG: hypothetical protein KKI15_20260 [Proteobacteria bacterium]|nr:hypothetical protein [Pseudomonadota bacterium]MBU1420820.1 hypothetical protein [Pseudomonadota bacterium]
MAEIRSTLDMVMERAARMAARAEDIPADQEIEQKGMRLVAEFLGGKTSGRLAELLQQEAPSEQMAVRKGMVKALIRNIILPRDESLMPGSLTAIAGLLDLADPTNEVTEVCAELKQILEQYSQHKAEIKQQLEDAMRTQLAQKLQQQGISTDQTAIDPTLHPQFREEWARAKTDLNAQYTQALDQRKEILQQRFS